MIQKDFFLPGFWAGCESHGSAWGVGAGIFQILFTGEFNWAPSGPTLLPMSARTAAPVRLAYLMLLTVLNTGI